MLQMQLHSGLAVVGSVNLGGLDLGLLLILDVFDVSHLGIVAVEDPGDLLEGGALGLDVEEEDKAKFNGDPDLSWDAN
jgi:hypothetical protein